MRITLFLALLFLNLPGASAGIEIRHFPSPALEKRYQHLIEELRCLVCQNQSLADSNADLAEDLRDEVYTMLIEGKQDQEIVDFLVNRYGDFVLYRPPVKKTTALLWFGPFAALAIGALIFWRLVKRRRLQSAEALSEEERHRLNQFLHKEE